MSEQSERLGPKRAEVLHHLRDISGPSSVAEVALAVDLHQNTTRFHLDALCDAGLAIRDIETRTTPGRPKVLYRAVRGHEVNRYQELATTMVRHFAAAAPGDRGELARIAGDAWGTELRNDMADAPEPLGPLGRVVDALSELGYQPTLALEPEPILELVPCPYAEAAAADPEVVCQLHLGLIRGLLGPDQPWTATEIRPYVASDRCLVLLAGPQAKATPPEPDVHA